MKRGEIHWATLAPRSGSEQQGTRPAIVVSRDNFNRSPYWKSIIVVPISTSSAQAKRGPTVVFVAAGEGGLPKDSVAICHQVTTLDRSKIGSLIGELPESVLEQVGEALKIAQDLT